jgi:hypothetical protein
MKCIALIITSIFVFFNPALSQIKENSNDKILIRGLVLDASTLSPISNSQIMINKAFTAVSSVDGSFFFYVSIYDTVSFRSLGYKESVMTISDTLRGTEFITGVYLNTDTLSIGEVIIMPAYKNLKSEILNSKSKAPIGMDNARYNVAVSAYQGRNSTGVLGNPDDNYAALNRQQKIDAFEKGGIPSNNMVGLNALLLIPATAYFFLHSSPEHAPPMKPELSENEVAQIHKKYLETRKQRK